MKLLLARIINHYKISPQWQIYILGLALYVWQLLIDYNSYVDYINGIMPYPDLITSYWFYCACVAYTLALTFTLVFRCFSVWIWLVYTFCLLYVVYHLPTDLITPTSWYIKHKYAVVDAGIIVHSSYFFGKGLDCLISFLLPYFIKFMKCFSRFKRWIHNL